MTRPQKLADFYSHRQESVTHVVAQLVTHVVSLDNDVPLHKDIKYIIRLEEASLL